MGNLVSITYEDGTHQDYSYNVKGQLIQSVNRRGQSISYEYNNNYQITKEIHSDGSIVSYGYGANSRLFTVSSINSSVETTRIDYDQGKNTITIENSIGLIHTYKFNALGRKIKIVIQDSANTYTTNYSYDSLGRLDKL